MNRNRCFSALCCAAVLSACSASAPSDRAPSEWPLRPVPGHLALYSLDSGTDDGVKVGDRLTVWRGNEFVTELIVDQATPKVAECRELVENRRLEPREGDRVKRR
ncbi:MAG: hypothetical protein HYY18_08765 [Planctomycetes bacterium]|nr:hypothetical protein [Planctomycetota bacterium]